jgi:DNA adenine methylase
MGRYRTPLRYPGGKQRLAPFIAELLIHNDLVGGHYVEPYAGGAGVALELLLDGMVSHIHLNDSALPIYAFWRSVVLHPDEMCRRIASASLNVAEWRRRREVVKDPTGHDEVEVGFSTLYLNRCNRSGVLSGGLIGGVGQTGPWNMDARFPRNELVRRIELIAARRDAISLANWDAERFIVDHVPDLPSETLVYCDPPYFTKNSRLYLDRYQQSDHARVAGIIQQRLSHRWVVSYDDAPEIWAYYEGRRAFAYYLQYSALRPREGREVFIFSDDLQVPTRSSLANVNAAVQSAPWCGSAAAAARSVTSAGLTPARQPAVRGGAARQR